MGAGSAGCDGAACADGIVDAAATAALAPRKVRRDTRLDEAMILPGEVDVFKSIARGAKG